MAFSGTLANDEAFAAGATRPTMSRSPGRERQGRGLGTGVAGPPELGIGLFSFLLHFVWEFLQVPAYAGMAAIDHWDGVKLCLSATVGDTGLAVTAFWAASVAARTRYWIVRPCPRDLLIFVATGIVLTIGFEYYHTNVSLRWTYADAMPVVPPFGTGLVPLLQWTLIPPVVVWLAARHLGGNALRGGSR
jgi:hypothetical protein